jgi:hypothetical protein
LGGFFGVNTLAAPSLAISRTMDASGRPNNAIFIFTGNAQPNDPSGRFMSRVKMLPFSKEGMSGAITALLASIWEREGRSPENAPNFARLVKDSKTISVTR